MSAGLYVHVPFCRRKCPYCHFYSLPYDESEARRWRQGIAREASLRAALRLPYDTLYYGGGSPSLVDPDDIGRVRKDLDRRLDLAPTEVTIEVNPGQVDPRRARAWRDAGVTRASLGVQSFDPGILRMLGRDHTVTDTFEACQACHEAGFETIGMDLMTGIPGEAPATVRRNLDGVEACAPAHVSVYFLENVEGLPFERVLRRLPVDEDVAVDRFEETARGLERAGFRRYEISNFAKPGRESRHNLKYWRYEPFVGLGPGAASHVGNRRWTNLPSLDAWAESLEVGREPLAESVEIAPDTAVREALVFGLRLAEGVSLEEFRSRSGVDLLERFGSPVRELIREGLLALDAGRLRIPADKFLVSNSILARLV